MKKIKKQLEKMVVKAAYNAAEKNANSVCGFFFYQPKQSDAVKKLRKFQKQEIDWQTKESVRNYTSITK